MGRSLVLALAVALACAACATEAPGQPVPTPGDAPTPPATSQSPSGEAPPINSPELDLASYVNRICELLTPEQVAPFAIRDPGESRDGVVGPVCTWNPPDTTAGVRITVTILSKVGYGWEGIHQRKDRWRFFEDAGEVEGYPVAHLEATTDGTEGQCVTVVGARQDLVFEVGVDVNRRESPEYRNACSVSDQVASLVIDTLKRGGR